MIDKKQIITEFDKIIGNNQEVTDDTHMDLVDECADYTETLVNKLLIANVSQQRELLLAFLDYYHSAEKGYNSKNTNFSEDISDFLANNCG